MRIYICDEDTLILQNIERIINNICEKNPGLEIVYRKYTDTYEMYKAYMHKPADLIMLEIDMPKIDGFSIAKKICNRKNGTRIIFVSSHEEMVFQSLKFQPYRFIRKTRLEEINEALNSYIQESSNEQKYYIVEQKGKIQKIPYSDIIYATKEKHNLHLFCKGRTFTIRKSMREFELDLQKTAFIRCHSGYIVNPKYISAIKEQMIVLSDDIEIPISRSKLENVKVKFLKYMEKEG